MIKLLETPHDNIVMVSASGKVTAQDYEDVLIPAVDKVLASHEKIRFLYQLGSDFEGYEAAAMWDDTKVGLKHFTHWERIALVTDSEAIATSIKAFGFLFPGEIKVFANDQFDAATGWISEQ